MNPDFDALRKQFPTLDNWIYLDTAAKAPLPRCAEEAMISYMADMWERVEERGFTVVTPKSWHERAGILSFDVTEPEMVRQQLLERKIVVNVRDGNTLRVAPHFYNTRQDIDKLVDALVTIVPANSSAAR